MNFLPEKKYGVPSHNFVKKNVLCEKGDEITRFDGMLIIILMFAKGCCDWCVAHSFSSKYMKSELRVYCTAWCLLIL